MKVNNKSFTNFIKSNYSNMNAYSGHEFSFGNNKDVIFAKVEILDRTDIGGTFRIILKYIEKKVEGTVTLTCMRNENLEQFHNKILNAIKKIKEGK